MTHNKSFFKPGFFILLGMMGTFNLGAQTTGLEIMTKVYERPQGPSMTADLEMTITNSRGAVRQRNIRQYGLDSQGVEKRLMFFTSPADVKDTSFMTWSYDDGRSDDQWIFLPAVRRVKRISADNKGDAFMGSDFTYEDLTPRHPSRDTHTLLGEESLDGRSFYKVESRPAPSEKAAYAKVVTWVEKGEFIGYRREFYDPAGKIFKTLEVKKTEKTDGYWVITDMVMTTPDKKSFTRIQMKNVSFNSGLTPDFFSERQMQMGAKK